MMESSMNEADRRDQVEVDDLKRDLSSEFSTLPEPQHSCTVEKEHLQVFLRIRPFTSVESNSGESQDCVTVEAPDTVLLKPPGLSLPARLSTDRSLPLTGQRFQFSQVHGPETTQRELFDGTVKDLVKDVLEGGNSLVFTYGVTNSGKTFTFLGPDADAGILPRSLDVIFSSIGERVFFGPSVRPHRCREFIRLTNEQQNEEALFKRNLFRQLNESEKFSSSVLNSTSQTFLQGPSPSPSSSSSSLGTTTAADARISLEVEANTKFSVWVSFCEIYNENIHDLLEAVPSGALRRTALRLSQDVKGNAFVKDLRWVQVDDAEEAYRVMKLGKKNQSFSSTPLNQLSSRSHSIFSVRILRIEDIGTPRIHAVSELCLCDLAGSERCAKTQNKGERLKEAGNINTSLLILGKCINALRHNQQAKLLQHVPFRESKLTHYLQSFFSGRGKACMIVNINQCASMYDETLNVLRFSAVAQKVVVLSSKPPPIRPQRSASEVSFIINNAERKAPRSGRRSSLIGWESSLEDVQEDEDDECEEEQSLMDDTTDYTGDDGDDPNVTGKKASLVKRLRVQLKTERAESLLMEARVREEISREFSELFSEMQNDYNERLAREREILEDRADRRMEIFKNLIDRMSTAGPGRDAQEVDTFLDSCSSQLAGVKKSTEAAQNCADPGGAGPGVGGSGAAEELEVDEQQQEEKLRGEVEDEERTKLLLQLREKSSEVARLEKRVDELQNRAEPVGEKNSGDPLQEALAALEKERRTREEALVALEYQTIGKEEALTSLEEERGAREEALREMTDKLKAAEQQVNMKTQGAEEASVQLQAARAQLEEQSKEIQEKSSQIHSLTQEVHRLQQEVHRLQQEVATSTASTGDQLREEVLKLKKSLAEGREENENQGRETLELQSELAQLRQQLENKQLIWEQQLEECNQRVAASRLETEELRKKLQEHEEASLKPLEELRSQLEEQNRTHTAEVKELRGKLEEQTQAAERQLDEKLREQEELSLQKLQEVKRELKEKSSKLLEDVKQKLSEQERAAELQEAKSFPQSEDLRRLNSDPQTEVASHSTQRSSEELQQMLKEKDEQMEQKLAEEQKTSARREEEVKKQLLEKEAQVASLEEARCREAETGRELLAAAHQAVAQRDEEISRLKENHKQESEKVKSLSLDLQRREDDASDLREKLADYKKQVQQVQREISSMREKERLLGQKLSDEEKSRKQLQSDLSTRDRTIQQLRAQQSSCTKCEETLQLHQEACRELEVKQRVMDDMRLALTEQEDTQEQLDQVLEEKVSQVQELSSEVENLKEMLLQRGRGNVSQRHVDSQSDDVKVAKQEAAQAQESLKACADKHQAERRKWLEEKLSLIGQAKEAEDKRNQEMRKFAEDRERYLRQQSQLESQLQEKDQTLDQWRTDRDALVSALEVQLQKLLSSQAEKDQLIQQLRHNDTPPPQEGGDDGDDGPSVSELQAVLSERDAEILQLRDELKASAAGQMEAVTPTKSSEVPAASGEDPRSGPVNRKSGSRDTRASVTSQGSAGCPSVLDSSEISTENGRTSRFPRPELEISFSPLQPNRVALRRQGEESAVTVKITRSARKRKSGEMEKSHMFRRSKRRTKPEDEVEAENRRNTRTKLTPKLTPHQEESSTSASRHDSQSSLRSRKEGTLQKIGDFLQSSPTLLGTKAKKMIGLVSGRGEADSSSSSSSSLSLRAKKNKRKLYRPEISSPMDMPSHPIISREPQEKESDHQIIKRRLRSSSLHFI